MNSIKKLDPARIGIVFGMMTKEEQDFIEEVRKRDKEAVLYFSSIHPAGWRHSYCKGKEDRAYWTYYEMPDKPDLPKYKTFEIDWNRDDGLPTIGSDGWICEIGLKVDGYRIFGFTDFEYCVDPAGNYALSSCSSKGNRKYAIGRLEND